MTTKKKIDFMYALRTRFKKDIVTEFFPARNKSSKVIIMLGGLPGIPGSTRTMEWFAKKGYWVFRPRYRGTWESGGSFLKLSPEQDVLDVIDGLYKPFYSIWDGVRYSLTPKKIILMGNSFGGPAALLAGRDKRVDKVVAVSPVVDWQSDSRVEPLDWLGKVMKEAFGEGYRYSLKDWNKLKRGNFYNPVKHVDEIDGKKVFIIHAKDDDIVAFTPVKRFAKNTGSNLLLLKKGGHLGFSIFSKSKRVYKHLQIFLKR